MTTLKKQYADALQTINDLQEQVKEIREFSHKALSSTTTWAAKYGRLQDDFDEAIRLHGQIVTCYKKDIKFRDRCFWAVVICNVVLILEFLRGFL